MKTEIDLFDNYETLPIEIKKILEKYIHFDFDYEKCECLICDLNQYGYTIEYGLDAEPFNLQLMNETKVFKVKNNVWIEIEFNPEKKQFCLYNNELKFKGIGTI